MIRDWRSVPFPSPTPPSPHLPLPPSCPSSAPTPAPTQQGDTNREGLQGRQEGSLPALAQAWGEKSR